MGQQYNKVLKRRRRLAYLERVKEKSKLAAASANKPRLRKPKAKTDEPAAAPKKAPKAKATHEEVAPETTAPETHHAEAPVEESSQAPAE